MPTNHHPEAEKHVSFSARIGRWLRWTRRSETPAIPLFQRVVIELQSDCNRECFFCCRESDRRGKRKNADGSSVRSALPTDKVLSLLDELESLGFSGLITFHQLSEAFLDKRLLDIAREARRRGMRPYIHTNGDVLRTSERLCREAAETFEYVVIGLYDYSTAEQRDAEKAFWHERLRGTQVSFSLVEDVYARTHSPDNERMETVVRRTRPGAVCAQPLIYLLVHYNGDIACCCEDMYGDLLHLNVFETSIRDAWYSQRHARIIEALKAGKRCSFDLCSKCTNGAQPLPFRSHRRAGTSQRVRGLVTVAYLGTPENETSVWGSIRLDRAGRRADRGASRTPHPRLTRLRSAAI